MPSLADTASWRRRLNRLVGEALGLAFSPQRQDDLEKNFASAARALGFHDPGACLCWLESSPLSPSQVEVLASFLTVGETYFFRNPSLFRALQEEMLPALIERRRSDGGALRLWSAGCASGEEAYSLAILWHELSGGAAQPSVFILGSDINPRALTKAARGVYSSWSFRAMEERRRVRYFLPENGGYRIQPEIQRLVSFRRLNLVRDDYPSMLSQTVEMDLILCCNVLMYFEPESAGRVVERLAAALSEGGYLFFGPSDGVLPLGDLLEPVKIGEVTGYRRPCAEAGRFFVPCHAPPEEVSLMGPSPAAAGGAPTAADGGEMGHCADKPEEAPPPALGDSDAAAIETAKRLAGEGRLEEAYALCMGVLEKERLSAPLYYLVAGIEQELGRPSAAVAALQRAIYLDPRHAAAHFSLGLVFLRTGNRVRAAKSFANVRELLRGAPPDEPVPGTEGLRAGWMLEFIESLQREDA